jgi:adenosylcobyric acid synthase
MAARTLMIQGTASHVGKSVMVSALCRLFLRRGVRVAPFKAQNMSNNSFVTPEGREIGRAQAVQAAACRLSPRSDFNPVLIKPESDRRAQVVVNGKVAGSLTASDFGRVRREWFPTVQGCFARLREEFDLVVLEGAGSPAEPNLREQDIVNMRMAREAKAPVLLVGDIDRGGVFAALVGTLALLDTEERRHVKGFLINKFRGDPDMLAPGIKLIEAKTAIPCLGVIPHWGHIQVPEEDSIGWETWALPGSGRPDVIRIGVADLPAISNFTDFEALYWEPDVQLVRLAGESALPLDALIFPGTKNTQQALQFVKASGLDRVATRLWTEGGTVVGMCGGYQILGRKIRDPRGLESTEREIDGLGLLDVVTSFARKKILIQISGTHRETGCPVVGYQVHMGRTRTGSGVHPLLDVQKPDGSRRWTEGAVNSEGRIFGTYVHGLFDAPGFRRMFLNRLRLRKGWGPIDIQPGRTLDHAMDELGDFVERHVDLSAILTIVEKGV